jgi:TPR repeat protein
MAILGHYLITGSHGRTDVARGLAYLVSAVNRGYAPACLWLGVLYEEGRGVQRDPVMARMLYEKGAAAGDEDSEFALARVMRGALPASYPSSLN